MSDDKRKPTDKPKEKEHLNYTAVVDLDVKRVVQYDPIDYLGTWDFIVVFLAVFLRLLVETNVKAHKLKQEKGEDFNTLKYFDFVHITRWFIHILGAFLSVIVLPEIFILFVYKKYDIGLTDWNLIMSLSVGLLGYDIIKSIEKLARLLVGKFTSSKSNSDD